MKGFETPQRYRYPTYPYLCLDAP